MSATSQWPYLVAIMIGVGVPIFVFDMYLRRAQKHWTGIERRKLDSEAARSQAILQTSLDAVVICDENSIIVEWNPSAERIFRLSRADALGRNLTQVIIPPEFRERHEAGMTRYRETGMESGKILRQRLRLPCCRADGTQFKAEIVVARIPFAYEAAPMFVGYVRDLDETPQDTGAVPHPKIAVDRS